MAALESFNALKAGPNLSSDPKHFLFHPLPSPLSAQLQTAWDRWKRPELGGPQVFLYLQCESQ
jgi:hypothetical protein